MFGRPKQWQAMLVWIWNYGNNRLIRMVAIETQKKGNNTSQCTHTDFMLTLLQRLASPQASNSLQSVQRQLKPERYREEASS